jgi:two-component system LytT family response regulator
LSSPVSAVVVDDEPTAREVLRTMLAEAPQVRIVGEATNGAEAVDVIRRLRPDLVFLDVQMPDLDGFGVLDKLGADVPRGVVFVTAHDEHAIRAFEVHALDYVLKPFGRQRFAEAVKRAIDRLRALDALTLQQTLVSMAADRLASTRPLGELALNGDAPRRIAVRSGAKVTLVEVDAIDWVEADGDYARIHAGKQTHLLSQRMNALENMLESAGFVRIHRSLIVRAERVRELRRDPDGGGFIVLTDGVRLRVARNRWDALERQLHLT